MIGLFQKLKTLNWQAQINCELMFISQFNREFFLSYFPLLWNQENLEELEKDAIHMGVILVKLRRDKLTSVVFSTYCNPDNNPSVKTFYSPWINLLLAMRFMNSHKINGKSFWQCVNRKVIREIRQADPYQFWVSSEDIGWLVNSIKDSRFLPI